MIHVVFLAQLREQLGLASVDVSSSEAKTLSELKDYLLQKNPSWVTTFQTMNLLTAVNHAYVKADADLQDGDEVAFFPPVTGG
jgi:molybdopterin synthase sulfur carrier subunit